MSDSLAEARRALMDRLAPTPGRPTTYRTLDLFSGCGGLTKGFELAVGTDGSRFRCEAAIDYWKPACDAFELNHTAKCHEEGVSEKTVHRVLEALGGIDVVTGGPPCQGFSTSGKRALHDPRNGLVNAYFQAVKMAAPRAFLMENVSGFTTFQHGAIFREVIDLARDLGYRVFPGIVLGSLHGVPQRRRRFILVGIREGVFQFPSQRRRAVAAGGSGLFPAFEAARSEHGLVVDERSTDEKGALSFDDATSDLPGVDAGEERHEYACAPLNAFQAWAREGAPEKLEDHIACGHRDYFVEMMSYIPQGRSGMDPEVQARIPEHLRPKSGFPNSYARIRGDEPAPTITRNFTTPSSANCIHPYRNRALTLREGARCQSFPDNYHFSGSHGDRRLMIGNAVPPLLARALAEELLVALSAQQGA